jgi:hypothetical protein
MKKGLLTILAASLVFVGCQNYDDQFDDLNAQISALKSQVDGLSSLSGQVASLSGTISGLQAGVNAAQAAAASAAAAAAAIETTPATDVSALATAAELTALSTSLAALQADVDAVTASLANTATAAAVTTLQAEIDAIEADLDDLLATSNIYSTDISVTNATTLNAALALGNKVNVLNADLTVTGWSAMSYTDVQTLVDRINTMTGNITYTAGGSTGTEVIFNNLTSVGNITMTQPGGYHFPKLTNAAVIDLKDDYETTVTRVNFPLLTTVTGIQTDATADTTEFTYATSVDFGSLIVTPNASWTITTKKDATLDIGAFRAVDAAGTARDSYTLTLNGPASFTNGTSAGTFASTGLPGNTLGLHDGTISLTNVATATIHNYRGALTLSTGVKTFVGTNIVTVTHSGATDLETVDITFMRDNDPALTAAQTADLGEEDNATAQDMSFGSTHTKLTSATVTGTAGDFTANAAPALTTVNLTGAAAFDVNITGNTALTTFTDATSANDWTFTNNDLMTAVNAAHTTTLTTSAAADKAASVTVTGNAEITTLTIGFDDVDVLNITSNAKLATIAGGTNLADNGTSTTTNVDIHQNALVAQLVRDTKESPSATVVAGAASDTGAITTASGIKDLDAFLTDAKAATGIVSVWFDTVDKLEIQATYGGTYTDTTSSVTAPAAWDDATAAANAVLRQSGTYAGVYAYMFSRDASAAVTSTTGVVSKERISYAWNLTRNATTQAVTALASNEGFELHRNDIQLGTWDQGDSYTGSANGSTVATVTDLIAFINADTTMDTGYNINLTAAQDGNNRALYTITYTNSTGANAVAGAVSTGGLIAFTFGTNLSDASTKALSAEVTATNTQDGIATAVINAINSDGTEDYAATATGGNGNQFYVTKQVSESGTDISPLITASSFPSITFQATGDTSTAVITPSGYGAASASSINIDAGGATTVNSIGASNSWYSLSSSKSLVQGLRLTVQNDGAVAMGTVGISMGVSNTGIINTITNLDSSIASNLMIAGTNIDTYTAGVLETPANYVAAFSDISSGTTTTTTAAVTAVDTDRTGW